MKLNDAIAEWAMTRPAWQQDALVGLAAGESFDDAAVVTLAEGLLADGAEKPSKAASALKPPAMTAAKVELDSLSELTGINALVPNSQLDFAAAGLTVIYGANGSGKSGYARVLKSMVNSRHPAEVLGDAFDDNITVQSAKLRYRVDADVHVQMFGDEVDARLRQINFYDEKCGDVYLTKESRQTYRPSVLTLFDGLIELCGRLKSVLDDRLRMQAQSALALTIPPATSAGKFVAQLSAKTPIDLIDDFAMLPDDINETYSHAAATEARLSASDPTKERARLKGVAAQLASLQVAVAAMDAPLAAAPVAELADLRADAKAKREAASVAAAANFDSDPLQGIGSDAWRGLWTAARHYAETEVHPGTQFLADAQEDRCPLCQQRLDRQALDRLGRFDAFVRDHTAAAASTADATFTARLDAVRLLDPSTVLGGAALSALSTESPELGAAITSLLKQASVVRSDVLAWANDEKAPAPTSTLDVAPLLAELTALVAVLRSRADAVDVSTLQIELTEARDKAAELKATIDLAAAVPELKLEVARLGLIDRLNKAKQLTDTKAITAKSAALMREFAADRIRDQFTRETERLNLRKVTLKDLGASKGQLAQKPDLLGARLNGATPSKVLSEGEQTALGLAGFFTEAEFDPSKSALVLDDPVTSLDHVRRSNVALRLAQFAATRQVIVFTHDVSFVRDLAKSADEERVCITGRSIERIGAERPGHVAQDLPWKAKDLPKRTDQLTKALSRLKAERSLLTDSDYERRACEWAGLLSEAWEDAAVTDVLFRTYDMTVLNVKPRMLKVLARFTDEDDRAFQEGYGRTSEWAFRHNKAAESNFVVPEPDVLDAELKRFTEWRARVKTYQNS